jgi:D-alanyl-lipoteichoic acid acyltransferase DltB (MBOAT superfamily)
MLFNSNAFVFVFLPIVLAVFFGARRTFGTRAALGCLLAASVFFYGWWNPYYVLLLAGSIGFNFALARAAPGISAARPRRAALAMGITVNLAALGYCKYANFFVANYEALSGATVDWQGVTLPIAISFFTFQQIAYLVDRFRGSGDRDDFLDYALFISFFPQLIAGPIVHHSELLPQLREEERFRFSPTNFAVGWTIFFIGLFKKTVVGDTMAGFATPIFKAADAGATIGFVDAWAAALSYSFEIYFDFSGYSDMAIGLARLFGLHLPINFESPYKARSIIDFWRRWHITLSRFLRDYLYIPMGGSRRGSTRRYVNLMITMLLGGIWHGSGWNFLIWGGLHGIYLAINHAWRALSSAINPTPRAGWLTSRLALILTFAVTVVAWVPFRAETLRGTTQMLEAMLTPASRAQPPALLNWTAIAKRPDGAHGELRVGVDDFQYSEPGFWVLDVLDIHAGGAWWLGLCLLLVWGLPSTREWMADYRPGIATYPEPSSRWQNAGGVARWRPNIAWALFTAVIAFASIVALQGPIREFIYFQF